MKIKKLATATLLVSLSLASTLTTAKEVIHTFSANDNKYEVFVGYSNGVYVDYAGTTDTKYKKGSGYQGCNWKYYGSCVSYSSMISDIEYKVLNHKY